jgi:hypothetical protein
MQMFFDGKFLKMNTAQFGAASAQYLEFVLLSGALVNFISNKIEKYLAYEPRIGLPAPLTEYKLTTPRREKSKKSVRKRNFKSKQTRSVCVGTSDLANETKKHTTKPRQTTPLRSST